MPEPERIESQHTIVVPAGYREAARLDVYLTRSILNASRTKVQRGIRSGRVSVNARVMTRVAYPVQAGDCIVYTLLKAPPIVAVPQEIPLDIVFEDEWLIVVNKVAGMVVHPAYGNRDGTLVNALLYHVGAPPLAVESEDDDVGETGLSLINAIPAHREDPSIRPGIVHRLDKDTSGLLVVAKDDVTHAHLSRQFAERTIDRQYAGIVWGVPEQKTGRIEGPIGRDPRDRKRMAVTTRGGKAAATMYEVARSFEDSALVYFRLESGRTHQIRVHASHAGHPIVGDETYGGRTLKRWGLSKSRSAMYQNILKSLRRQALHALSLGFEHPHTGRREHFASELPADMREALKRLERADRPGSP